MNLPNTDYWTAFYGALKGTGGMNTPKKGQKFGSIDLNTLKLQLGSHLVLTWAP